MIRRDSSGMRRDGRIGPRRIAVYGEFGGGNFGNDASLDGLLRLLEACGYPAGEVTCFSRGPDVVSDVYGMPGVRISGRNPSRRLGRLRGLVSWAERLRDLFRMRSLVGAFSHVIVPGTGIVEDGVSAWSMPLDLFWLALACRLRGTRLVVVCVGVGVPRSPLIRYFFRYFLRSASYRSYRDQQSKRAAASIGVAVEGDPVYADLAFGLPMQSISSSTAAPTRVVGMGVIAYAGGQSRNARARAAHGRYVAAVLEVVQRLAARDCRIRLLIGDRGDQSVVEELLRGARSSDAATRVSVMEVGAFQDVVDAVASCDVLVASRFHNLIGAALAGCPTIAIGYSPKHRALQEALGLAEFDHDIASIDVDRLFEQIETLSAGNETWRSRVRERVGRLRLEIDRQGDDLCGILQEGGQAPDLGG